MRIHSKLITGLIAISSFSLSPLNQRISQAETTCIVYGKVLLSLDSRYKVGQDLCEGQRFTPKGSIFVACWIPGRAIWINKPDDVEECQAPKNRIVRCTHPEDRDCIRLRGQYAKSPVLLTPYGETLLRVNPALKWLPIDGSDRYVISILGKDKSWNFITKSTNFIWPNNQSLSFGQTYQVIIRSFKGNKLQGSSVNALNVLSSQTQKDVQKYIAAALKIYPYEAQIKSVAAVYTTYNLSDECINYLEENRNNQQTYPLIYRLLGDTYTQVGLVERARVNYQSAYKLASQSNIASEVILAKLGLMTIEDITGSPQ